MGAQHSGPEQRGGTIHVRGQGDWKGRGRGGGGIQGMLRNPRRDLKLTSYLSLMPLPALPSSLASQITTRLLDRLEGLPVSKRPRYGLLSFRGEGRS